MKQKENIIPFEEPHEITKEIVEIIEPIFDINTFVKLAINQRIKNKSDEELRRGLINLINYLNQNVYKK